MHTMYSDKEKKFDFFYDYPHGNIKHNIATKMQDNTKMYTEKGSKKKIYIRNHFFHRLLLAG